jgi:hypothetical protein
MRTIENRYSPEPQSNADQFITFIEEKYGKDGAVTIDISSQAILELADSGISLDDITFTPGRRIMVWLPLKEKGIGKIVLELIQKVKEDARVLFGYIEESEDIDLPPFMLHTQDPSKPKKEYFNGDENFPIVLSYEQDGEKQYLTFSGHKPDHVGKLFLIPE